MREETPASNTLGGIKIRLKGVCEKLAKAHGPCSYMFPVGRGRENVAEIWLLDKPSLCARP